MAPPIRKSGRQRKPTAKVQSPSATKTKKPTVSIHPSTWPIDASRYTLPFLRGQFKRDARWTKHLDFVRMEEKDIIALFVTDNIRRQCLGVVHLPPLACRRTKRDICNFYKHGKKQQLQIIEEYSECEIVHDFHSQNETRSFLPPQPCGGITLKDIRASRLSSVRIDAVETGFAHVVREGWQARAKMFHPDPNKNTWTFRMPITGAVLAGFQQEARWHRKNKQQTPARWPISSSCQQWRSEP